MHRKQSILIVEDEPAIRTGLVDVFVFHGYDVDWADTGDDGLAKAQSGRFDLVLLDVMLPGMNGFDVCASIRESDRRQPIIMLTAKLADDDIVNGLELGADDYVAKPFAVAQLVLRVKAVLRRSSRVPEGAAHIALRGNVEINTATLTGSRGGEPVRFTRRELDLVHYLLAHADRVVSRDDLLVDVWGYASGSDLETRTVDIHIAKLRKKIEPNPSRPTNLITVRGVGYQLVGVVDPPSARAGSPTADS